MALTLTGHDDAIVWGYHTAASVVSWSLSATGTTGTLTAKVSKADSFKLTQQDLKFRVRRQTGTSWEWPIDSLHIADQTITATVRLQE